MTTEQHDSKTEWRGDWQPVLTPENADERRMFDHSVQVLGGGNVLRTIAGTLLVYARQAPQNGSYAQSLYIMANEVAKAASTSSPQSPPEPGRGDDLARNEGGGEEEVGQPDPLHKLAVETRRKVTAALAKPDDGSDRAGRGDLVHIRTDRGLWRPKAEGYTNDKRDAGRWLRAEAERMTDHLGPEKCLQLIPVDASPSDLPAREAIERAAKIAQDFADAREKEYDSTPKSPETKRLADRLITQASCAAKIASAIRALQPLSQGNGEAPGHTDLMITPEAIDEAIEPLYAAPPSQPEGVREALEGNQELEELRLIAEENAENVRLLDYISDKIGLPKDEELSCDNFAQWLATTPSRGLVEAAGWQRSGIYIASKCKHADRWRLLRDKIGLPIKATWIDEAGEGETSDFADLWRRNISEACSAEVLIINRERDEVLKGAWIEMGAALACGVPVYAVGIEEFTIAKANGITHFRHMRDAVDAAKKLAFSTLAAKPTTNAADREGDRE